MTDTPNALLVLSEKVQSLSFSELAEEVTNGQTRIAAGTNNVPFEICRMVVEALAVAKTCNEPKDIPRWLNEVPNYSLSQALECNQISNAVAKGYIPSNVSYEMAKSMSYRAHMFEIIDEKVAGHCGQMSREELLHMILAIAPCREDVQPIVDEFDCTSHDELLVTMSTIVLDYLEMSKREH